MSDTVGWRYFFVGYWRHYFNYRGWRQQILDSLSKYSRYPKMIVDLTLLTGTGDSVLEALRRYSKAKKYRYKKTV